MAKQESSQSGFELTSNSPDDPRMHKSWGYITALPSEYLIHREIKRAGRDLF